ncbi:hypothetical protein [Micromonospora globbae]|uniref:hypothetical protein n=1 Tax=Micromonospora globbae TaxID=1894969 RepID=UPI0011C3EDD9|nr:hypothetical protein [Micromonospora globbae]
MNPSRRQYRHDIPAFEAGIAVDRLRLSSPLETVLAAVASDVKPLGYAVVAMGLLKSGLGVIMDWQRHRAELRQMERGWDPAPDRESAQFTDEALSQHVIVEMQQRSGIPGREAPVEELNKAIRRIVAVPILKLETDTEPPERAPR